MANILHKYYIDKVNKLLNKLNSNCEKLTGENNILLDNIKVNSEKITELNYSLQNKNKKYSEFLKYLVAKGLVFEVSNRNNTLKQWENLKVIKSNDSITLKDSFNNSIKIFQKEYVCIFEDVCELGYSLSFIVIRVEGNKAIIQLRFNPVEFII